MNRLSFGKIIKKDEIKVPDIINQFIFKNRAGALKFGDARKLSEKLSSGDMSDEEWQDLYDAIADSMSAEIDKILTK